MKDSGQKLRERHVGKTFTLTGPDGDAAGYYDAVRELADACESLQPDRNALVAEVRSLGSRPRLARRLASSRSSAPGCFILQSAHALLSPSTTAVMQHLRTLPFSRRFGGVLAFTVEQYHLAMLEIELMNRLHTNAFRKAGRKLAFLPHCLRDLEANCRAAPAGIDRACTGCSAACNVNAVSALLREHGVEPYLWMSANLKKLFRELKRREDGLGVMGIACVPELVRGMRMTAKLGVPVVGVPLNANRCARWMGEFHPTSVELAEVRRCVEELSMQDGRRCRSASRSGSGE